MVAHSRTTVRSGPDQLRPLYQPVPVSVITGEHERPKMLTIDGQAHEVEKIEDDWVIEDEWWRSPIHRIYYDVWLLSGARRTVFHDLIEDQWYLQDDPYPLADSPHSTR